MIVRRLKSACPRKLRNTLGQSQDIKVLIHKYINISTQKLFMLFTTSGQLEVGLRYNIKQSLQMYFLQLLTQCQESLLFLMYLLLCSTLSVLIGFLCRRLQLVLKFIWKLKKAKMSSEQKQEAVGYILYCLQT